MRERLLGSEAALSRSTGTEPTSFGRRQNSAEQPVTDGAASRSARTSLGVIMDIKETMEALDALEVAAEGVIAACADKKLNLLDLQHAIGPMVSAGKAVEGANLIPAELKDVDAAEAAKLGQKLNSVLRKQLAAWEAVRSLGTAA